jgi:hypothetical protein
VNQAVLDGFGTWRELAYRKIEIAIYGAFFRRPIVSSDRALVEEISNARWEAEHRQQTYVR